MNSFGPIAFLDLFADWTFDPPKFQARLSFASYIFSKILCRHHPRHPRLRITSHKICFTLRENLEISPLDFFPSLILFSVFDLLSVISERPKTPDFACKEDGCSPYLLGVKKAVLVPLGVLSLKRSPPRAFAEPFRVLSRRNISEDNALF